MHVRVLPIARTLVVCSVVLMPPALGVLRAVHAPTHVELAPGLSVEATLRRGGTSDVNLGALGAVHLPQAHTSVPVLGRVAATVRVDPVTADAREQDSVGVYTALLHDPATSVADPVLDALTHQVLAGAIVGLAVDLGVGAALLQSLVVWRRWRRELEHAFAAEGRREPALPRSPSDGRNHLDLRHQHERVLAGWLDRLEGRIRHLLLGLAAMTLAVGTFAAAFAALPKDGGVRARVPLSPALVRGIPYLRGATVTGSGAEVLVNQFLSRAVTDKRRVDRTYRAIVGNLESTMQRLVAEPMLHDPRYVVLLHISDGHCALPYYEQVLPALVRLTNARVIVDTGDTDVSTGTLPFEAQCVDALRQAVTVRAGRSPVSLVAVMGNHDGPRTAARMRAMKLKGLDGRNYHPITVLDGKDDNRATVAGIAFVGSADPRRSVLGTPIQPTDPQAQRAVVAAQGTHLADVSCEVMSTTGLAPVVLAHDSLAPEEALRRGCTGMALSGHTHRRSTLLNYAHPSGVTCVVFTQGTSSGVGEDTFTLYAEPQRDAPTTVFVWDTFTDRVAASSDIVIHPDATVTVTALAAPPTAVPLP